MKRIAVICLGIVLMLIPSLPIGCSDNGVDKGQATQVAQDWVSSVSGTNKIATEIASKQPEEYIDMFITLIELGLLGDNVTWSIEDIDKLSDCYLVMLETTINYESSQTGSIAGEVSCKLGCDNEQVKYEDYLFNGEIDYPI